MSPRRRSSPPLPGADRLDLPNGLVAWRRTVDSPRGRTVLLHGWESHAGHLTTIADAMVDVGHEVIALDAPAHGASPGTVAHPVAFAQALTDLVATLGTVDVVVGHSMGGGAVLLAASEGLPVERIVTIGAPASITGVLHRFARYVGLPEAAERAFVNEVAQRVGKHPAAASATTVGDRIRVPLLVVHDVDDAEVPFHDASRIVAAVPGACLRATHGLGHRRILRDQRTADAVAAWATVGVPSLA